ncbi:hypothetical protein D3C71_1491040 [compost metagenome]
MAGGRACRREQADGKTVAQGGQRAPFDARPRCVGVHGHSGQNRYAEARGHHPHQRGHAVGFAADTGAHGGLLHQGVQILAIAAALHGGDQGECRQRVGPDAGSLAERMARRHHDDRHVAREDVGVEVGVVRRPAVHHAEVGGSAEHGLSRRKGVSFLDRHLCSRMRVGKTEQLGKQQTGAQGLRCGDADCAALVAGVVADLSEGIVGHREQLARTACQPFSGGGQPQAVVLADEQRVSDALLKRLHLFGNAGLRQVDPFGGLRKAQRLGCRDENFQLP